jgi:hypothetical protein
MDQAQEKDLGERKQELVKRKFDMENTSTVVMVQVLFAHCWVLSVLRYTYILLPFKSLLVLNGASPGYIRSISRLLM